MSDERPFAVPVENRLMGQGIYLTDWERTGDAVDVEYEVVADHDLVTSDEVGTVVRTVLGVADERGSWDPATLRLTSTTTDGDVRGRWRVEAHWFRRLGDDLSEVEFSTRVLETVESGPGASPDPNHE